MDTFSGLTTFLAHGGIDDGEPGTITPPIHQGVNHAFGDAAAFDDASLASQPSRYYRRFGNPTQARLEHLVAGLEHGEAALATASGMGAVSTTLLALLSSGDHVMAQHSMYGGTLSMLRMLGERFGIDVTFVDQTDVDAFEAALTPRTRLVMLETPTNPLLTLTDLDAVTALARRNGVLTWVDNTVATPVNQTPLRHGVDLVMHSLTKSIGGHSDMQGGIVVGRRELVDRLWATHVGVGAVISPFDAWLALRGARTLELRARAHNRVAQTVAEHLSGHPRVRAVHYPGLPTHPQHALARTQMRGFGGLLSVEIDGDSDAAERWIDALRLPVRAASLGGTTTTVIRPAAMWAHELDDRQLAEAGVPHGLLRIAVGMEDPADLIADLDSAFARL